MKALKKKYGKIPFNKTGFAHRPKARLTRFSFGYSSKELAQAYRRVAAAAFKVSDALKAFNVAGNAAGISLRTGKQNLIYATGSPDFLNEKSKGRRYYPIIH